MAINSHKRKAAVDRLCEFPELIITILCLLGDMKEVVRTSVLSESWKYHWTHVDSIVYKCELVKTTFTAKKLEKFMLFVDKTLMQCVSPKIKKFSLSVGILRDSELKLDHLNYSLPQLDVFVDKWLNFVLERGVQDINLGGLARFNYVIPARFYNSSSLSRLEINEVGRPYYYRYKSTCKHSVSLVQLEESRDARGYLQKYFYKKTFSVNWRVLKILYLKRVYVKDGFMVEMLVGCPVLQTLVLDGVGGMLNLIIKSRSVSELKLLNLSCYSLEGDREMYIIAPWVTNLEVGGLFDSFYCKLGCVSSLKKANLTFSYESIHYLDEVDENGISCVSSLMIGALLKPVCNADELIIGAELLKVISIFELTKEPSMILECKDLSIHSPIPVHEVPGIVCLLASSPKVENLVISMMPWQCRLCTYNSCYEYAKYVDKVFTSFNGVEYLTQQEKELSCLKNVKIDCREQSYSRDEDGSGNETNKCFEFEIAEYIIKHAPFLEKLVILCSETNYSDCGARYYSLLSSKHMVGKKVATRYELKKMDFTYEYSFYH